MAKAHSHYENLQVARNASPEAIRASYKSLSQKYHPDRNPGDGDSARIMVILNLAYETLSSSEKRQQHDAWIARTEASGAAYPQSKNARSAARNFPLRQALRKPRKPALGWILSIASVIIVVWIGNPPKAPPSPGPKPTVAAPTRFDLAGARAAGYSDDDIVNTLAKSQGVDVNAARKAGYTSADMLPSLVAAANKPVVGTRGN